MQLQPILCPPGHGQQFHLIAHFQGILHIGQVQCVDSLPRDPGPTDWYSKRKLGQDSQFLGHVGTIDIHRRVGLRKSEPLGLSHGSVPSETIWLRI